MKKPFNLVQLSCAITAGLAFSASADVISAHFLGRNETTALAPQEVAGLEAQPFWGNIDDASVNFNGTSGPLLDNAGHFTATTVKFKGNDSWNSNGPNVTANDRMMLGIIKQAGAGTTAPFSVNNVGAGPYDVILYLGMDADGVTAEMSVNGVVKAVTETHQFGGDFIEALPDTAGNYVRFNGVVPDAGSINIGMKYLAGGNGAGLAGIQVIGPAFPANTVPAAIKTPPVGVEIATGTKGNFSVVAVASNVNYQWFKNGQPIPGATRASYTTPAATLADNGTKFSVAVSNNVNTDTSAEVTMVVKQAETVVGKLSREYFKGKIRSQVENDQAGAPTLFELVSDFSAPSGIADDYAQRISGFFTPAVTGDYVLFTASDDDSDLFISTDATPGHKVLVANQPGWGDPRQWVTAHGTAAGGNQQIDGTDVTQKRSDLYVDANGNTPNANGIHLNMGTQYYIEGVHHEGGGGDNFAATFKLLADADPNDGDASAFTGSVISTSVIHGDITVVTQPTSQTAGEGDAATFTSKATATGVVPAAYQWQKNGQDIPGATKANYTTPFTTLADDGAKYKVIFSAPGSIVPSTEVTLRVVADTFPPTVVSASGMKHINNDQTPGNVEVDIVLSESLDAATLIPGNFTLSAGAVTAVRQNTNVSGLSSKNKGVVLTTTGLTPGSSYTVTINNVADTRGNKMVNVVAPVKITKLNWIILGNDNVDHPSDATAISDSGFNLNSGGNGYWNNQDDATFVYEEITGDFDKVARVEYQDPSSQWGRAGLAARESLNSSGDDTGPTPASRYQQVHANPSTRVDGGAVNNSFETNRRLTTGGGTSSNNGGGTPLYPNAWIRLRRWTDKISMYRSDDGVTWTQLGTTDFNPADGSGSPLAATMLVGFAYGPESGNNDIHTRGLDQSWAANFRDYSDFTPNKPLGKQTYAIGVNFTDDNGSREGALGPKEVAGVDAVAQANWNTALGVNSTEPLVLKADKQGVAANSTATVEWVGVPNTWSSTGRGEENNKLVGSDHLLMTGFLDTSSDSLTQVTFTGLPSQLTSGKYDVLVYTLGGVAGGRGGAFRVTDAAGASLTPYVLMLADENPTSLKQVPVGPTPTPGDSTTYGTGSYVLFSNLSASSIIVEATTQNVVPGDVTTPDYGVGGANRAPINAIQIVPHVTVVVVPPSISISSSGVLTFVGTLSSSDSPEGPYAPVAGATSPRQLTFSGTKKFYRASN